MDRAPCRALITQRALPLSLRPAQRILLCAMGATAVFCRVSIQKGRPGWIWAVFLVCWRRPKAGAAWCTFSIPLWPTEFCRLAGTEGSSEPGSAQWLKYPCQKSPWMSSGLWLWQGLWWSASWWGYPVVWADGLPAEHQAITIPGGFFLLSDRLTFRKHSFWDLLLSFLPLTPQIRWWQCQTLVSLAIEADSEYNFPVWNPSPGAQCWVACDSRWELQHLLCGRGLIS